MTSDEKAMYTGMAISRNTEVTLRWSRSQMFMIINSAMLSIVFTRDASFWLLLFLGIFGMIMAAVWLMINEKSQQWVEYWQTRLAQIKHMEEPDTVNVFIGPEWETINKGLTFHKLLKILPSVFVAVWIGVLIFSFTRL